MSVDVYIVVYIVEYIDVYIVDIYIGVIYIMPTNGGCMSVCVNFGIRYIYCANHWRKCIS